jgi:hypothetical protein
MDAPADKTFILNSSEASLRKCRSMHLPPVHLKGFALRINFDDAATAIAAENIVKFLHAMHPVGVDSTLKIVFDGDSFSAESFTALIPRIWTLMEDGHFLELVAHVRRSERDRFAASWQPFLPENVPITVHLQPDSVTYTELGIVALRHTLVDQSGQRPIIVAVLGGGLVVKVTRSRNG